MRVLRAAGEPNLVYVMLTDAVSVKSPLAKRLRAELRKVLR